MITIVMIIIIVSNNNVPTAAPLIIATLTESSSLSLVDATVAMTIPLFILRNYNYTTAYVAE